MKGTLNLLVALSTQIVSLSAMADTFYYESEGIVLEYIVCGDERSCEVIGTCSTTGDINIPETVFYDDKPYSVVSIGESAFLDCSGLTSVKIPNSVTAINNYAFSGCSDLTSVNIPNSVSFIGSSAFSGCSRMTSIDVPNSVYYIGNDAFFGCSGLTSVNIPSSVTTINSSTFSGCSGLTSVNIPNSITTIGGGAFAGCSELISVDIPNSVSTIDGCAFYGCSSLKTINIPTAVSIISELVFYGCSNLTSVIIPASVSSINHEAFGYCTNLTSICYNTTRPIETSSDIFPSSVYNEATLQVARGGLNNASQTIPWKLFNNISETYGESNSMIVKLPGGNLHLAEEHAGSTVRFTADDGFVLHSASLDDEDVTNLLSEHGHFTVPTVEKPTILNVVFKQVPDVETAIKAMGIEDELRVTVHDKMVRISGKDSDVVVSVYDLRGVLINETTESEFYLNYSGVVILRVGSETFKFAI